MQRSGQGEVGLGLKFWLVGVVHTSGPEFHSTVFNGSLRGCFFSPPSLGQIHWG